MIIPLISVITSGDFIYQNEISRQSIRYFGKSATRTNFYNYYDFNCNCIYNQKFSIRIIYLVAIQFRT